MFNLLAQSYSYTTEPSSSGSISPIFFLLYFAFIALLLVSMWKVYVKAGKPGWASLIPIYNIYVQLEIIGRPVWWLLLLFIPFVNFVVAIIIANDLSKSFGKGAGMTLLLIFLPFIGYPMLAFGEAKYVGPVASGGTPAAPVPVVDQTPPSPVS